MCFHSKGCLYKNFNLKMMRENTFTFSDNSGSGFSKFLKHKHIHTKGVCLQKQAFWLLENLQLE